MQLVTKTRQRIASTVPPPRNLSKESAALWTQLCKGYGLYQPAQLDVLEDAMRAHDQILFHRKLLSKEGPFRKDERNVFRAHLSQKAIQEWTKIKHSAYTKLRIRFENRNAT